MENELYEKPRSIETANDWLKRVGATHLKFVEASILYEGGNVLVERAILIDNFTKLGLEMSRDIEELCVSIARGGMDEFGIEKCDWELKDEDEDHAVGMGRIFDNSIKGSHGLRDYFIYDEEYNVVYHKYFFELLAVKDRVPKRKPRGTEFKPVDWEYILSEIRSERGYYGSVKALFGKSEDVHHLNNIKDILDEFHRERGKERTLKYYDYHMAEDVNDITVFVVLDFWYENVLNNIDVRRKDNMYRLRKYLEEYLDKYGITAEIIGEQNESVLKLYIEK